MNVSHRTAGPLNAIVDLVILDAEVVNVEALRDQFIESPG